MAADEEEEDDYLSMSFTEEAGTKQKETSIQRIARLKKEAAERGRIPSKAEREANAKAARDAALSTAIDSSNKGAKLMAKMGFKGGALGKTEGARTEPINVELKDDRGGIGMDTEKKRKIREAAEATEHEWKKRKVDENEYRERNRLEREEKRFEGMWWGAMKVLGGLDTSKVTSPEAAGDGQTTDTSTTGTSKVEKQRPIRSVNLLWRPLARSRVENEREKRMRYDLHQSLSTSVTYDDPDEGEHDKLAYGNEVEELEEEDPELDGYVALPLPERLEKIVAFLRAKYSYCFWCKFRYPDDSMDGCPGLTEDEHG